MMCANCKVVVFEHNNSSKTQTTVCPTCKLVYYCSEECRKNHHLAHKEYCSHNGSQKRGTQEIANILQSDDMWLMLTGALLHVKSSVCDVLCCRIIYDGIIPDRKFTYIYKTATNDDLPGAMHAKPGYWTIILTSINKNNIGDEQNDGLMISFLKGSCLKYYYVVDKFYPGMDLRAWSFPIVVDHYNVEYPIVTTSIDGQETKIIL